MKTLIDTLEKSKLINVILLFCFFLLVVLPHEAVGLWITDLFKEKTRDEYNYIILMMVVGGALLYFIPILWNVYKFKSRRFILPLLLLNMVLAALCFNYLFVINIEAIHFLQYGIFAILAFPLTRNYSQTLGITAIAGALDEAYQYFYLAPQRTEYFDFNDVIINTVGAVFGLILLRSFSPKTKAVPFFKSPSFYILSVLVISFVLAYIFKIVSISPVENIPYNLIRVPQEGFWTKVYPEITFHVTRPLEGTLITVLIILVFSYLGRDEKKT